MLKYCKKCMKGGAQLQTGLTVCDINKLIIVVVVIIGYEQVVWYARVSQFKLNDDKPQVHGTAVGCAALDCFDLLLRKIEED